MRYAGSYRSPMLGLAAIAGMMAAPDRVHITPTLPNPPVIVQPKRDDRRKKKGPAPKPMNRKHLDPRSAFMRQIAEERAIGIHPKYRHSHARAWGPSAIEWEQTRDQWRKANPLTA